MESLHHGRRSVRSATRVEEASNLEPTPWRRSDQDPSLAVGWAPSRATNTAPTTSLDATQRRRRAEVILGGANLPTDHPDAATIAERHERHRQAFAPHGVVYTPTLILPEGGMPAPIARAIRAQLKAAHRLGPLTSGKTVAHAESLARQEIADLDIRPIGEGIGSGVFARSPIKKGTFLGEYTGALRFLGADVMWPFLTANGYSFEYGAEISLKQGIAVIDGLEQGNFTRFLNHSYHPNAVSRQLLLEDGQHTYFVAQRDIAAGEQVSINYTRGYWKGRGKPTPI